MYPVAQLHTAVPDDPRAHSPLPRHGSGPGTVGWFDPPGHGSSQNVPVNKTQCQKNCPSKIKKINAPTQPDSHRQNAASPARSCTVVSSYDRPSSACAHALEGRSYDDTTVQERAGDAAFCRCESGWVGAFIFFIFDGQFF